MAERVEDPCVTKEGSAASPRPANLTNRKAKTVSFHSATSLPTERKISSASACLHYMMSGSSLIKVRPNSRQYHRFFTLAEDLNAIRWTPTSKKISKAMVTIDSIKEIRAGKNTDVLRAHGYAEECAFSILYGDDFESLDLVASTPEEANIWVTGLNALVGAQKSPDGLEEKQALRERWLQEMFDQATTDDSGCLDQCSAIDLLQKLSGSGQVNVVRVRQKLAEFDQMKNDGRRGTIDSKEFIDMFKEVATRPEIYFLLIRFANKDYLTCEDLQLFLEGEQGMTDLTQEKCLDVIKRFEPTPEARENGQLLIDGFTKYLLSEECDILDPAQREVCQDMSCPLAHYFISTSHNTYLLEDQLKGPSSVEGLIRALGNGCRCIKVDCWDGTDEPVVFRGNTLTSKISFRDCIEVIKEFAFVYSPYPLLLHLDNHCNIEQQKLMVSIIKNTLKNMLYVQRDDSQQDIGKMSPNDLKGKILILGKKLPSDCKEDHGDVTDEDEGAESSKVRQEKRNITLSKELSDLVTLRLRRFLDFQTVNQSQSPRVAYSLPESAAVKMAHGCAEEFVNHNKTFLTRVYPNGSRIDSSNFNPQDFWNCGCQLVALNFQTPGQMMDLYDGKFKQNGGCGYVLKPAIMREEISLFSANARDTIPGISPQTLHIKIISGQQLPRPRGSTAKGDVIDPYVLIQLYGIPADCAERKTRTVSNEGDCPVFEESFEFHLTLPEMVLVRFVVLDDDYIGDDFIGQYTIPFECLQTGYRHIRLLSNTGEPLESSTLFVHVAITNKKGGGKPLKRKSKFERHHVNIRAVGLKQIDDAFRGISQGLDEAQKVRQDTENAMDELRTECGLNEAANMKQCLRVLLQRLSASPQISHMAIQEHQGLPMLKVDSTNLPTHLHRAITTFEKTMTEFQYMITNSDRLINQISSSLNYILEFYEDLPNMASQSGIKGKKFSRLQENYTWNVRVLRGQIDLLESCRKDCKQGIAQVKSSASMIGSYNNKERSPSVMRNQRKLNLYCKRTSIDTTPTITVGKSPTSPVSLSPGNSIKPKSILKKSNSNIEQGSVGCVNVSPTNSTRSNSWVSESLSLDKN
ncbi:inactive phospholipase C-like protein 2 isoform X2 [Anabrus simplex]|uniref:inactive phospholipase C-like protein 2 isoform X2 n=1 Tax=Anabrus simplex TaxID=316456 RepID=UPI0034DD929F